MAAVLDLLLKFGNGVWTNEQTAPFCYQQSCMLGEVFFSLNIFGVINYNYGARVPWLSPSPPPINTAHPAYTTALEQRPSNVNLYSLVMYRKSIFNHSGYYFVIWDLGVKLSDIIMMGGGGSQWTPT